MTTAVVLTSLLTAVGSNVKRWPLLTVALLSSVATDFFFIADLDIALGNQCRGPLPLGGTTCISGFVGLGNTGSGSIITWGFKTGFYVFVASGILTLAALGLWQSKSRQAQLRLRGDDAGR